MKQLSQIFVAALLFGGAIAPAVANAQASPSPYTSAMRYDAMGRVVGTIAPDPDGTGSLNYAATRTTYDVRGNVIKVETGELASWQSETVTPASWSGFTIHTIAETTYDAMNRKLTDKVSGKTGTVVTQISLVQYSYDSVGRLECTAMRMNPATYSSLPASACTLGAAGSDGPDRITRMVYDAAGQVLQVRKAVGTTLEIADVTNSYTLNGQLEYVIDANGNRAKLEYDGFDRQVKWIFPSTTRPGAFNPSTPATALASAGGLNTGDYEQYTYDANGNRLTLRKRDGQVISYVYDSLNRVVRKGGPAVADVDYTYDLRGLQLSATFLTGGLGVTYAYDGFGRLVSETQNTDGVSRTVSSQYDLNGNRTRVTHPDGQYFQFDYDGADRLTNVKQATTVLGTASYNTRGLPSQLAWSYLSASANKRSFGYDNVGRLSSIGFDLNSTSKDVSWSYTRNPASQITSETQSNDSYSWNGYVGLSRAYATNGLNQYTSAGSASFTYDAKGNLTSDGTYTFNYDIENRLVSRTGGGQTIALSYDPTGRLYQITGGSLGTQRFIYDGNALIGEYNGSGTLLRRYVHGSNLEADDPLIVYEGSAVSDGARRYLHADPRGSIMAVTNYQGTSLYTNSYDEYGIPDSGAGNDITTKGRFRYTGQAWIPELGMYYYKSRIYSPTLGRFLQVDPIGYEDQFNLYAYVANDPINGVDPTGWAEVETKYYETESRIARTASVTVDADFDNDGTDDLSQGQLDQLGKRFSKGIIANDGADFSDYGKPVTGTASLSEKAAVSVVSQFVGGVYGSDINWGDFSRIEAHGDSWFSGNYSGCGGNAAIACAQISPPDRWVSITGRRYSFLWGSQYSDFTNLAVILTHESLHFQLGTMVGDQAGHDALQQRAQRLVRTRLGSVF